VLIYVPDALDVLVPLAVGWSVVLAAGAPRLAQVTSPHRAVRLLSAAAVGATLSAGVAVVAGLSILLARVPVVATWGRWAAAALPEPGVSWLWALPVALVVTVLLLAGLRHLVVVLRQLWLAQDVCRTFAAPAAGDGRTRGEPVALAGGAPDAEWVVVDSAVPEAYAVPWDRLLHPRWPRRGGPERAGAPTRSRGQVVVSQGMLDVLTPRQQQVLLHHERAHLQHRHYFWVQLSEVAAVLNPALRGVPALVRAAAEREADLVAAAQVGDATLTARAIAVAALARSEALRRSPEPARPLQATGGDVVRRVEHLLHPVPLRHGRVGFLVLSAIIVLSTVTSVGTFYSLTARLQHAQEHITATDVHKNENEAMSVLGGA